MSEEKPMKKVLEEVWSVNPEKLAERGNAFLRNMRGQEGGQTRSLAGLEAVRPTRKRKDSPFWLILSLTAAACIAVGIGLPRFNPFSSREDDSNHPTAPSPKGGILLPTRNLGESRFFLGSEIIFAQSYAQDGKVLGIGKNGTAKAWDASTGKELWSANLRFEIPQGEVWGALRESDIAFNGAALAVCPLAGKFGGRVWDIKSLEEGNTAKALSLQKSRIADAAGQCPLRFSQDGKCLFHFVRVHSENQPEGWDLADGNLLEECGGSFGEKSVFTHMNAGEFFVLENNSLSKCRWSDGSQLRGFAIADKSKSSDRASNDLLLSPDGKNLIHCYRRLPQKSFHADVYPVEGNNPPKSFDLGSYTTEELGKGVSPNLRALGFAPDGNSVFFETHGLLMREHRLASLNLKKAEVKTHDWNSKARILNTDSAFSSFACSPSSPKGLRLQLFSLKQGEVGKALITNTATPDTFIHSLVYTRDGSLSVFYDSGRCLKWKPNYLGNRDNAMELTPEDFDSWGSIERLAFDGDQEAAFWLCAYPDVSGNQNMLWRELAVMDLLSGKSKVWNLIDSAPANCEWVLGIRHLHLSANGENAVAVVENSKGELTMREWTVDWGSQNTVDLENAKSKNLPFLAEGAVGRFLLNLSVEGKTKPEVLLKLRDLENIDAPALALDLSKCVPEDSNLWGSRFIPMMNPRRTKISVLVPHVSADKERAMKSGVNLIQWDAGDTKTPSHIYSMNFFKPQIVLHHPNKERIFCLTEDSKLVVISTLSGEILKRYALDFNKGYLAPDSKAEAGEPNLPAGIQMALSPTGNEIAISWPDNSVKVFDLND